jgi:hypothetical protein
MLKGKDTQKDARGQDISYTILTTHRINSTTPFYFNSDPMTRKGNG